MEAKAGKVNYYTVSNRDRFVCWLANRVLRFASPQYRDFVTNVTNEGLGQLDEAVPVHAQATYDGNSNSYITAIGCRWYQDGWDHVPECPLR